MSSSSLFRVSGYSGGRTGLSNKTEVRRIAWPRETIGCAPYGHAVNTGARDFLRHRHNDPVQKFDDAESRRCGTAKLPGPGAFYELKRSPKQFEILFIVRCVGSIDLNPLPRTCHPAGLKWNDVASRELQLGRGGGGYTQSNAVSAYTGEHLVVDEKGVKVANLSCADAWKSKEKCIDLRFAACLLDRSIQGGSKECVTPNAIQFCSEIRRRNRDCKRAMSRSEAFGRVQSISSVSQSNDRYSIWSTLIGDTKAVFPIS